MFLSLGIITFFIELFIKMLEPTVPVPHKEQVIPQGTQSPGVGESEKKKGNLWSE